MKKPTVKQLEEKLQALIEENENLALENMELNELYNCLFGISVDMARQIESEKMNREFNYMIQDVSNKFEKLLNCASLEDFVKA